MQGSFTWFELMTTDLAAAERFYADVVGWTAADSHMPDLRYTVVSSDGIGVGGMMALTPEMLANGARPGWMGYVEVDDVDATAAQATSLGAKIHHQPTDIPGIGRFAVIADPQGAIIVISHGTMEPPPPQPSRWQTGALGWAELHASDREAAFAFYSTLFGWKKGEAVDMGPMGIYQIFAPPGTAEPPPPEQTIGGMMTKMPDVPHPFWLYYFNTSSIEAAIQRIAKAGGQLIHGPQEVPGGMWILMALDPQGGMFAMVGPKSLG